MERPRRWLKRAWLLSAAVAALIAGHGAILYFAASHAAVSFAVVSGLMALVLIKHLGMLASLYSWFGGCARSQRKK